MINGEGREDLLINNNIIINENISGKFFRRDGKQKKGLLVHNAVMQIITSDWIRAADLANIIYHKIGVIANLTESKIYSWLFLLYIRTDNKGYRINEVIAAKKERTWYLRRGINIPQTHQSPLSLARIAFPLTFQSSNMFLPSINSQFQQQSNLQLPIIHPNNNNTTSIMTPKRTITEQELPILNITSSSLPSLTNESHTEEYNNKIEIEKEYEPNSPPNTFIPPSITEHYTIEEARLDEFLYNLTKKRKLERIE